MFSDKLALRCCAHRSAGNRMENKELITVAALTGRTNDPASFFRIRQHIPSLLQEGIRIDDYLSWDYKWYLPSVLKAIPRIPAVIASYKAGIVWISRALVCGYETFERLVKRPRVLDADDAVWLNLPLGRLTMSHIARGMDAIIAGNKFLADWFSRYCRSIHIVPTAVDLGQYHKRPFKSVPKDKFVIGWTGMASTYKYLRFIERPLGRFLQDHPDAELLVIAEKKWDSRAIAPQRINFVRWSRDTEAAVLHRMSVGIMPLTDEPWSRGKCGFKMLQYMAVGLPVVVSPVGMNNEILEKGNVGFAADSENDWYESLDTLYKNATLQMELGSIGRAVVEKHYSANIISKTLAEILRSYADS
jgi:glycosyltransferase involved in cell wall biosynthesis